MKDQMSFSANLVLQDRAAMDFVALVWPIDKWAIDLLQQRSAVGAGAQFAVRGRS